MQNFRNLGASGGGGDHYLTKPQKAQKADFTRFEPCVQIRSRVFSRQIDEERVTTKSHRGHVSPICREFPTQPHLTKIGI